MKVGRNDPCPCGSGKKYKKCCFDSDQQNQSSALERRPAHHVQTFASSLPKNKALPRGVASWPIVRVHVPVLEIWRATAQGTVGILRRQPDGRYAEAYFTINLMEHGLHQVAGKHDQSLEDADRFLADMRPLFPPMEEGPIELASTFAWGARAFSELAGYGFPASEVDYFYGLMPRPAGSLRQWRDALVGLCDPELVEILSRYSVEADDIPDGKELVLMTEAMFDITDAAAIVERLRARAPAFLVQKSDATTTELWWTRPIPPTGPRVGGQVIGDRQVQGTVVVGPRKLVVATATLSFAARLIEELKRLFGDAIRLDRTRWIEPS